MLARDGGQRGSQRERQRWRVRRADAVDAGRTWLLGSGCWDVAAGMSDVGRGCWEVAGGGAVLTAAMRALSHTHDGPGVREQL